MNGEMRVLPTHVLEGVKMPGGRETCFRAGDVESGDLLIAKRDTQFGDLPRPRRVPHRSQQQSRTDKVTGLGGGSGTGRDPVQHSLHDLVQRQTAHGVQLRCEPDLGVDDPVGGQILDAFRRHPDQRLPGLHHGCGVHECLQVPFQRPGVRRLGEPARQVGHDRRRQAVITIPVGEIDQRRGPQTAVQMVVQQDLRCGGDGVGGQWCRHPADVTCRK